MGLLASRLSKEERSACVPKRRLLALQARVNPPKLEFLTEDKAVFYSFCKGLGLPVPELYAVFGRPAGWAVGKGPLVGRGEWEAFFADSDALPPEVVVKPAHGAYGRGVRVLERSRGGYAERGGPWLSPADLYLALASDARDRKFVLQQRLRSHPDLENLSGVSFLQTVRAVTHVEPDGRASVVMADLKVIAGDRAVDNYDKGRSGNLCAHVDPASGCLDDAVGPDPCGAGVTVHKRHPRTRLPFSGFALPDWDAALQLLSAAASALLPLRSVGWDVALTLGGPVLVEANMWWDPPNDLLIAPCGFGTRREMVDVLRRLERDAQEEVGPRD